MKRIWTSIRQQGLGYYVILFGLAAAALLVTFIPYLFEVDPAWEYRLKVASGILYVIFLLDFFYFWFKAEWCRTYISQNWVSLLALFTPLKGLKALKGIKGLKALKGAKVLKALKLGKKIKSAADTDSTYKGSHGA